MVRDVYARDDALAADPPDRLCEFEYVVLVDPDPFAIARVAGVLALSNAVPTLLQCQPTAEGGGLRVRARIDGLSGATAELLVRKLAQLICVVEADHHEILQ